MTGGRGWAAAALTAAFATTALAEPGQEHIVPVGTVDAGSCSSGVRAGHAGTVRIFLGCLLIKAAIVDPAAPDRRRAITDVFTSKVGRTRIRTVDDALIARWAEDPASGPIPYEGFEAQAFEQVELVYPSPPAKLAFRGVLVAREGGAETRRAISGAVEIQGTYRLKALEIGPVARRDPPSAN